MTAATQTQMTDYERAVAWQTRSMAIAERDQLVATRKGYGATCEMFEVPSRSHQGETYTLTLYHAGEHAGQAFCPCRAQANGLPCGHIGAMLLLLDQERANMAVWAEATAGYGEEV